MTYYKAIIPASAVLILVSITIFLAVRPDAGAGAARGLGALIRAGGSYPATSPPTEERQLILPPTPSLSAGSFLVQLIGQDKPLAEKESNAAMRPASITKLLTALLAAEELDASSPVVFSHDAKSVGEKISSVPEGTVTTRDDAIRLALIGSANDAAAALAEALGRTWGAMTFDDAITVFVQRADKKAREIGMQNSHFINGTGLDETGHYTTAWDLFLLIDYLWKRHPEIWRMTQERRVIVALPSPIAMSSTNKLLDEFPAILGGKTGWTDEAGETLILLYPVRVHPTTLGIAAIVILGSQDRFEDGRKIIRWLEEAFP